MTRTIFQPIVGVTDDGKIDVDFESSMGETWDDQQSVDPPENAKGYPVPAEILDKALYGDKKPADVSEVEMLRNLANYIERQQS